MGQTTIPSEAQSGQVTVDPPAHRASRDDVLLLLDAVIADLDYIVERNRHPRRLPAADPAATVAGQMRTLNRHTDRFSVGVQGCLDAVAEAIERAARRGL